MFGLCTVDIWCFHKFVEHQSDHSCVLEKSFVDSGGWIVYVGMRNWNGKSYQVASVVVWITIAKCLP